MVLIVIIVGIVGYFIFFKKSVPYAFQAECEQKTGKQCYLFRGLCQVMKAQNKSEEEANEKFLKDCLSKIGTWQPIETVSQTSSNISSWNTYTNKKYDYQINYPADWAVEVDGVVVWQNQVPNPQLGNSIMFFGTKTEPYGQTARTLWDIRVFVSPAENPKKLSLRDWYIEQSKLHFSYGVEQKFDNLEDTTLKGLQALKVRGNPGEGYSFLIVKGSIIYSLSFSFEKFSGGDFPAPPEEIFLEMLNSFILN